MLLDSKAVTKLARQNMSLAEKIADFIDQWAEKVKAAFESVDTSRGSVFAAMRAMQDNIERMQELWDRALLAAEENYNAEQVTGEKVTRKTAVTEESKNAAPEGDAKNQFIGESAESADKGALAQARELDKQGVDNETIRQQTGWFKGMDGKWRYEIPGNRMEYYRFGDARFRQAHPEYAEYQDLMDKVLTGELTKAEETRLSELDKTWGNEIGRLSEIVERGSGTLDMILQFDELFEAYPQLRKIRVEFDDLGKQGLGGSYDDKRKTIVLGNHLKRDTIRAKAVLAHEIQHAIQHIEGFTPGASVEYWSYRLNAGYRQEVEKKADQKYNALFDGAPEELKNKIRAYNRARIDKNWELADELENELYDSEYSDLFSAIDNADFERRNARYAEYNPVDMYYNTAGEIEARDAERRSTWDEGKRTKTPPDLGNSKTIFSNWDDGPQLQTWDEAEKEFGIRSLNDYIGVQKDVVRTLDDRGFFDGVHNIVKMENADMTVEITRDGIRETLGPGDRFQYQPREVKQAKIATINQLPEIIRTGTLTLDNAPNEKNPKSDIQYAYLTSEAVYDGKPCTVKVTIRKSRQKNKFWLHSVEVETQKESDLSTSGPEAEQAYNKAQTPAPNIADTEQESKAKTQEFDEIDDDTEQEARGREIAYARIESENAILRETVEAVRALNAKQGKTIERLQQRLHITTTPETRMSDARTLARALTQQYGSGADIGRIAEQKTA